MVAEWVVMGVTFRDGEMFGKLGEHRELWYHEQGDRSWLVVTRNTVTHEISKVELARDVARAEGRSK